MDWWIVKQLRAQVLTDLSALFRADYFENPPIKHVSYKGMKSAEHFSRESRWGQSAYQLGKQLYYEGPSGMSARQVSASDMLMNLGILATTEAAHGASKQVSEAVKSKGLPDRNVGAAAEQLEREHLPICEDNVQGALRSYLLHLTASEARPFLSLLRGDEVPQPDPCRQSIDLEEWSSNKKLGHSSREQLFVDTIDSFDKVRNVERSSVSGLLSNAGRIELAEDAVQMALEAILNVPNHRSDWGGETNDLYTSNIIVNGQRRAAAFLLKGKGTKSPEMQIKDCGKNGDQIVRLFDSPADIFVVQYVGQISDAVIKDVRDKTRLKRHNGANASYLIINGQDTARLLVAYGKLSPSGAPAGRDE